MGKYIGKTTAENCLIISDRILHTFGPSYSILNMRQRTESICPPKDRKKNGIGPVLETTQMPINNRIAKLWYIHTVEYYLAERMNNRDKSTNRTAVKEATSKSK